MAPTVTVSRAGSTEPILVGGSPEHRLGISGDNWNRVEYELQWPGRRNATSGAYYDNPAFRANTERLDDGDYALTYDLNPGPVSRYPFTVRDGAIVPTGRQALGADPRHGGAVEQGFGVDHRFHQGRFDAEIVGGARDHGVVAVTPGGAQGGGGVIPALAHGEQGIAGVHLGAGLVREQDFAAVATVGVDVFRDGRHRHPQCQNQAADPR